MAWRCWEQRQSEAQDDASPAEGKIAEVVRYVNDRFAQPLSLTEVALRFYLSSPYLSRKFKQTTGFSFVEYVRLIRVKQSQRLLRESNMRIIDISMQVGYDNLSHFGRAFKSVVGVSPLNYRKNSTG